MLEIYSPGSQTDIHIVYTNVYSFVCKYNLKALVELQNLALFWKLNENF